MTEAEEAAAQEARDAAQAEKLRYTWKEREKQLLSELSYGADGKSTGQSKAASSGSLPRGTAPAALRALPVPECIPPTADRRTMPASA